MEKSGCWTLITKTNNPLEITEEHGHLGIGFTFVSDEFRWGFMTCQTTVVARIVLVE